MKKILVTFIILSTFILYSFYKRQQNITVSPVSQNQNLPSINPDIPTSTIKTYKDGEYIGNPADAFYGNIQVKIIVNNGLISDVIFLQYPNDRNTSVEINTVAMPLLKSEAITAQSSQVDIVSGATDSSKAFIESLGSALNQAKI